MGVDPSLPLIIQVGHVWGETLLDVRHMGPDQRTLRIGDRRSNPRPVGRYLGLAPLAAGAGWSCVAGDGSAFAVGAALSTLGLSAGMLRDELASGARSVDLLTPLHGLPADDFPLVAREDGRVYIQFTDGFHGFVDLGEGTPRSSLAALVEAGRTETTAIGRRLALETGERAVLSIGEQVFFVREVQQARRVVPGLTHGFDMAFTGMFLLLLFIGLVAGVVVRSVDYDPSHDIVSIPDRFAEIAYLPPEPPPPKKLMAGNPDAGEGAKAKGAEGKVGREDAKLDRAKGTKVAMHQATLDKRIAESAGLLADLSTMESDMPMFGTGGIGVGASAFTGGVIGSQYGNQYGSGGLGSRGSMYGGGGTGELLGGMGVRGRGPGGSGDGSQGGWYGRKKSGVPGADTGDPILIGGLEKSQIDRVVKNHLTQIRFCYQKELNRNPHLEGKVVIKFVIDKDGLVSSAKVHASSLDNAVVENCICERFHRFEFPKPRGNGIVLVTYPFYFHRS